MKEFTYRYFWQDADLSDEERKAAPIRTALLSGVEEVHLAHIRRALSDPSVCNLSREYVCEFDCDLVGRFIPTAELAALVASADDKEEKK